VNVGLNLKKPLGAFQQDIGESQVRLRSVLRSIEDGSYHRGAQAGRPGAVLKFQFASSEIQADSAAATACNDCFLSFIRALVELIDRLLAMRKLVGTRLAMPTHLSSHAALDAYAWELIEAEYHKVARDVSLSNPGKVARFDRLDSFEKEATLSYFTLRRCLEHHGGVPNADLTITYYRPYLVAGKSEITRLGESLPENTGIALTAEVPKHVFPSAKEIKLNEADIEYIGFTLVHVIGPGFTNAAIPTAGPVNSSHGDKTV
jgi:hypothetical protein